MKNQKEFCPAAALICLTGSVNTVVLIGEYMESTKLLIHLNGWQTIADYAAGKKITYRHVFKLIRDSKVQHMRIAELNNLQLVKDL